MFSLNSRILDEAERIIVLTILVVLFFLLLVAGTTAQQTTTLNLVPTSGTITSAVRLDTSSVRANGHGTSRYRIAWISTTGGHVSVPLPKIYGHDIAVTTNPGSTAPTDNYDITLTDEDGLDVLNGKAANRDTANTERVDPNQHETHDAAGAVVTPAVPSILMGASVLFIANAGSTKVGEFILDVEF